MMFRLPVLSALLCLLAFVTSGQVITGTVTDQQQEALAYATVVLYSGPDSVPLLSSLCDTQGNFAFTFSPGNKVLYLETAALGFETQFYGLPVSLQDTLHVNIALLPESRMLGPITIQDKKNLIERRVDRTVFNVAQSVSAAGADVYDMLKKTPGVRVNKGSIGIVGKSTVSVMINDRLVSVDGDELEALLRSMPASGISKIEVITAPSARHDAQGNSGILNIVTKKNRQQGYNGNMTASYTQKEKGSAHYDAALNYRNGKWNVYANTSISAMRFISLQKTNTFYPQQAQFQVLNQDNRPTYTFSQIGLDYQSSANTIIGFLYTFGSLDAKRDEDYENKAFSSPGTRLDSVSYTNAYATEKGRRNVFNINYEWKIDSSGKKLTANLDYFTRKGDKSRDFTTAGFLPDGAHTGIQTDNRTYGKQATDIATARVDLELPVAFAALSGGIKTTFIHNNSDNVFTFRDKNNYLTDPGKTNAFDYRENTQAGYVNAQKTWGKWSAQLGLRAELTQTRGHSITLSKTNTNAYFKIFPTAFVQYKPNEIHSWNINYSRRIDRPSFWDMNPFRVYTTETSYEEGNPFLQPSFSNNVELGYAYKSILAFTFSAQQVSDVATRVSHIDTVLNAFYFGQANAGNTLQLAFSATLSFSPLPFWESTTQVSGVYSRFRSSYYHTAASYGKPSFSIETNNTFQLNRSETMMAELLFAYNSAQQSDFDQERYCYNIDAALKALLFRKKLVVTLSAEDIFRTDIWQTTNLYNGTFQYAYFDSRLIRLAFTWKFGNEHIKEKRQRNTNQEEAGRAN